MLGAGIATEAANQMVYHLTVGAILPAAGIAIAAVGLTIQLLKIKKKIRNHIVEGVRQALRDVGQKEAARLREAVGELFKELQSSATRSIDGELLQIDANIQAIIDSSSTN